MRVHGPTAIVGLPSGISRTSDRKSRYHQLRSWWTAHRAARHQAKLATLHGRWDARR